MWIRIPHFTQKSFKYYLTLPGLKLELLLCLPDEYHYAQWSLVLFIKETTLSVCMILACSVKDHDWFVRNKRIDICFPYVIINPINRPNTNNFWFCSRSSSVFPTRYSLLPGSELNKLPRFSTKCGNRLELSPLSHHFNMDIVAEWQKPKGKEVVMGNYYLVTIFHAAPSFHKIMFRENWEAHGKHTAE